MSRSLAIGRRALFVFRGPDSVRYLNGQLTQDVRNLGDTALPACVTDAKGRLQAYVHVFRGPDDTIWVEAPAELEDELEARLGRYLIADDAEMENVSSEWTLYHLVETPETPSGFALRSNRLGSEGYDLWLPVTETCTVPALSGNEAEALRIAAKVPAWGRELTPGMLPPEAGLDRYAISYHKGCYIGQEVLSRIKSAGKVNRRLTAFLVEEGARPGEALLTPDGKEAGILTSVSPLPDKATLRFTALGYLGKSAFGLEEFSASGKMVNLVP
jgi:folate-binding protein YgfZ